MEGRYFLIVQWRNGDVLLSEVNLVDRKLGRIYCGVDSIGSSSISFTKELNSYNYSNDFLSIVVGIDRRIFFKIRSLSMDDLKKTRVVDFLKDYSLEEWFV